MSGGPDAQRGLAAREAPEDYAAKHDLPRLFAELQDVLCAAQPPHPVAAALAALEALQAARCGGVSVADYRAVFSGALPRDERLGDAATFAGFTWDASAALPDDAAPGDGRAPDGGSAEDRRLLEEALRDAPSFAPAAPRAAAGRRFSVSAEPYTPRADAPFHRVVVPKSDATRARIVGAVRDNLLFRNLDADQMAEVVDAMFEKRVAPGAAVVRQGDEGDYFYVIEAGRFEVVRDGARVVGLGAGETFGELALMYGHPRMATVSAAGDGPHVLWAVDRRTFRCIVIDLSFRKRRLYEAFVRSVPLFATLFDREVHRLCDALQPASYAAGDAIVRQGDAGHDFFVIESGTADVLVAGAGGDEVRVSAVARGDYFGELALLRDAPRAATVRATSAVRCLSLSKADFVRLLGPAMALLQRSEEHYRRYEEYLRD